MSKIKDIFRYLYISFLFALLGAVLFVAVGGFFFEPKKIDTGRGATLDEASLVPTKARPEGYAPDPYATATYTLDASDVDKWTYFSFSTGGMVEGADKGSLDWDLAFKRARITTNSGATNKMGKGGAAFLDSVKFDHVASVPQDVKLETDHRPYNKMQSENRALWTWYDYDYFTHRLDPKPGAYIIRTAHGEFVKMRILSYYCLGNKGGCYTFQYSALALPVASHRE